MQPVKSGGLHKTEAGLKKISAADMKVNLPKIDVGTDKGGMEDFAAQMKRLAEADQKKRTQGGGLQLRPLDVDAAGLLDVRAEALVSPVEKYLRQAKQLIEQKKYKEALAILAKALKEEPDRPEARYMAGLCYYKLGKDWLALRVLHPLAGQQQEGKLGTRLGTLRDAIRARMQPALLDNVTAATDDAQRQEAIKQLGEAARLDPEVELYHYIYAGCLMMGGRLDEALAAIDRALKVCPVRDPTGFQRLRQQILELQLDAALQPALRQYRKKEYAQARTALGRLSSTHRNMPLCLTFDGFLKRLQGGLFSFLSRPTPATVDPPGTRQEADALYFFLVRQEIHQGKVLMSLGQFGLADQMLVAALTYAPRFPYANFLRALCLYDGLDLAMQTGQPPTLEQLIAGLEAARVHARVGATNPEIGNAAALLQAIEATLAMLAGVREEARVVNKIIEEFEAARQMGGDGISSVAQLDRIVKALRALQQHLARVRGQVRSDQGRTVLSQIDEATRRNLGQLEQMRESIREEEQIGPLFKQFNDMMQALEIGGGIKSKSQFDSVRTFFRTLRNQVETARRQAHNPRTTESLRQLLDAINTILRQMGD